MVTLPIPKFADEPTIAPNIAGFINPSLDTWDKYTEELEYLNMVANKTIWGTHIEQNKAETATGRFIDVQPVINRLNKYADVAEFVEWKLSEWVYRYVNPNAKDNIASIQYGRRYIIESPNVILEQYEKAKSEGDNLVILDRLLNEYITSKYKNSPISLREELLKSKVEPYVHLDIEKVNTIFGSIEAQRKQMFSDWWLIEADTTRDVEQLLEDYNTWFDEQMGISDAQVIEGDGTNVTGDSKPDVEAEAKARLKGSVGGVQGILGIQAGVAAGTTQYESE